MAQRTQKTKEMEEEKIKMKKSCSNNAIKLFSLNSCVQRHTQTRQKKIDKIAASSNQKKTKKMFCYFLNEAATK